MDFELVSEDSVPALDDDDGELVYVDIAAWWKWRRGMLELERLERLKVQGDLFDEPPPPHDSAVAEGRLWHTY